MTDNTKFPLILWENTEEYNKEYAKAKLKLDNIRTNLQRKGVNFAGLDALQIDKNGNFHAWYNSHLPLDLYKKIKNANDAIEGASKYGIFGWRYLDELQDFLENKGPIFEDAMWELGYKKSTVTQDRWVKVDSHETRKYVDEKKQISYIRGKELERLSKLWVHPNGVSESKGTHTIAVGTRGLVLIDLLSSFEGSAFEYFFSLNGENSTKAHIAKQQDGFYIDAKNVALAGQKGVYIKAVKPDTSIVECIWPSLIPKPDIYALADDLVSRVK
jgi:hypothetical protein